MGRLDKLQRKAEKARVPSMERHVLVCTDGDCGGSSVAKAMRKAVAKQGLRSTVTVTKVDCFDICRAGTLAVVYPDGTWYQGLDEKVAEEVVTEHLAKGRPVEDHVFLRNPLGPGGCRGR